jgi:phosphopantothenoylcysteine decarboxylase / phosphopantothenate---cysteine ligase
MLQEKKILLGVTGSIAAYKSALLVRSLVKEGAEVRVIMTDAARDFISPLTLSTLSRQTVLHGLFDDSSWANHVMLGRWADVMLIAPLSCHTLSKMAGGGCDNLLMAVYLSATCPVVVAPAMDEDMWKHPTTRKNLDAIRSFGNQVIPVTHGELASGLVGEGRMAEPDDIVTYLSGMLASRGELAGKRALVTAGPTYEPIDPVRFIGNHSTGKMGVALARELRNRGASVMLVLGPTLLPHDLSGLDVVRVSTAEEMYEACVACYGDMDIAVMSAAVADFTPINVAGEKIKKKPEGLTLEFRRTRDILQTLGSSKKEGQFLVGFALETDHGRAYATGKLQSKNADLIVLNSLEDSGAGFGHDTNKVTIFDRNGGEFGFSVRTKTEVARDIVDVIVKSIRG